MLLLLLAGGGPQVVVEVVEPVRGNSYAGVANSSRDLASTYGLGSVNRDVAYVERSIVRIKEVR